MAKQRRGKLRALNVWSNGRLVGEWTAEKNKPQSFQYTNEWVTTPDSHLLSLSMPFNLGNPLHKGESVEFFFDNLLPDNEKIRERIQTNYGTEGSKPFDLLAAIGRDCVGSIQLLPLGEEPTGWDIVHARPLNESEIEQHLSDTVSTTRHLEERGEFRISLAGAQEKTALLRHNGQWCAPEGVTPTTHILKLPLGKAGGMDIDMSSSVENEWLCSKIMGSFGMSVANCEINTFGASKVLVVERFDRRLSDDGSHLLRNAQEDICQALGVRWTSKYELEGGPSMSTVLELLRSSSDSRIDRRAFYKTQIIFWMLAAIDGHAKNFSIFLEPAGRFRMTPLYDVLSAWPVVGEEAGQLSYHDIKLAMAFRSKNANYAIKNIIPRHFYSVADKLGLTQEIEGIVSEIIESTPQVVSDIKGMLPDGFPEHVSVPILTGLQNSLQKMIDYEAMR